MNCLTIPDSHAIEIDVVESSRPEKRADTASRYVFIDYMKCIGIFLIVYGHLEISDFERCFLWTFHVPLFFLVSGFLTPPGRVKPDFGKKALRLLLPYVSIYLITTCIVCLLTLLETRVFPSTEFVQILIGMFWGNAGYAHFPNAPLWFLPSLFVVEVLFSIYATRWRWVLTGIPLISIVLYTHHIVDTWMSVDLSLLGLNFFIVGYGLRASGVIGNFRSGSPVVLLPLAAAMLAVVWWLAAEGNLWAEGNSVRDYVASFAGGVVGSMMIAVIAVWCERCFGEVSWVSYVSRNTLLILGFHFLSNKYTSGIVDSFVRCDRAFVEEWHLSPLLNSVYAAVSILLLVPFIWGINRYCPLIGGRRVSKKVVPA